MKGLEALKEHFKNSKFPSEMDHYLPVVFSPPRDGKLLSDPLPIVGLAQNKPLQHEEDEDDDDNTLVDNNTNESGDMEELEEEEEEDSESSSNSHVGFLV